MIAKCECQQCGQSVEFDATQFERNGETSHRILGQAIDCPNCGKPTQLYLNRAEFNAPKNPGLIADLKEIRVDLLIPCVDCGKEISKRAFLCPSCGSMGKSLFFKICDIVIAFYFVSLFFALCGWITLKLIELAFGN